MELNMQTIGNRIKQRRTELGLKQVEVYKEVGISSGRLSDLESGKHAPSLLTLYRLSIVLNCSIDWLITGNTPQVENSKFSITGDEQCLLDIYRQLSGDDKKEINGIIKLKLEIKKGIEKNSSQSPDGGTKSIA